jgi:hypothetical protein
VAKATLVVFTVSFHKSQHFSKQFNVFCSPSEDSAIKAMSSAYKIRKSCMYICIDYSQRTHFEQAHKALFAVYRKIRNISIPVDLQLKLFNSLVSPILLYASEVWGFENKESIEKVHLKGCSKIIQSCT